VVPERNVFGERLRELRVALGKSLRQLGSEVGVSAAFLSLG
jgi:transcriptional regulator with XRE-family HTH domain